MNTIQKILGTVFPPVKFKVLRIEGDNLYKAIIGSLPEEYEEYKSQAKLIQFTSLSDWPLYPDFKFISHFYPGDSLKKLTKRGVNKRIVGLKIYSYKIDDYQEIELLFQDNLPTGLKIGKHDFDLNNFDPNNIDSSDVREEEFEFEPSIVEVFCDKMPDNIKELIDVNLIEEVELNNRSYFSILDLEDGNCIAFDKNYNVYSLIHDATPVSKKLELSAQDFLIDLKEGRFDKEEHLNKRYKASR